jgi:hypothetical protein
VLVTDVAPVPDSVILWDLTVELYDAGVYNDAQATSTAVVVPAVPSPYDGTPDICLLNVSPDFGFWNLPQIRRSQLWGASKWSSAGSMVSFTAAKVNDADIATSAFQFGLAGGSITLDCGAGNAKEFRELTINAVTTFVNSTPGTITVSYSDDNVTYTAWYGTGAPPNQGFTYGTQVPISPRNLAVLQWIAPGVHRYWRISWPASAGVNSDAMTESQFYEWTGVCPFISGFNIYGIASGALLGVIHVDVSALPTSTNQQDLSQFTAMISGTSREVIIIAKAVNAITGAESRGLTYDALGGFSAGQQSAVVGAPNKFTVLQEFHAGITITGGMANAAAQPRSLAYNSAVQTITTATLTALTFDTNSGDVGSVHSTSVNTSRFKVPTGGAGVWLVVGQVAFAGNAVGVRDIQVKKNGTTYVARQRAMAVTTMGYSHYINISYLDPVAADGDYYEFMVYQESGGNLNTDAGVANTFGSVVKLW